MSGRKSGTEFRVVKLFKGALDHRQVFALLECGHVSETKAHGRRQPKKSYCGRCSKHVRALLAAARFLTPAVVRSALRIDEVFTVKRSSADVQRDIAESRRWLAVARAAGGGYVKIGGKS